MQYFRKALSIFVLCLLFDTLFAAVTAGWNHGKHTKWSLNRGFEEVFDAFGGAQSFWTLTGLLIICALFLAWIIMMALHQYEKLSELVVHVGVALAMFIAMGIIGLKWLKTPQGGDWVLLGIIALLVIQTLSILAVTRQPRRART